MTPGWVDTALAPLLWLGESVRAYASPAQSTLQGALRVAGLLFFVVVLWFVLAQLGEWRRPSLPAALLWLLQIVGIAALLSVWRAPPLRVETPFTAIDFQVVTTHSDGLLTPQQQIDRHRKAGFKGLVFTDSPSLPQSTLDGLRAANPDLLLLNGSEQRGPQAHLLFFGARVPAVAPQTSAAQAIAQAKKVGALVLIARPWQTQLPVDQLMAMGADGVVAWSGNAWNRELAQRGQARNWIVIGDSTVGDARELTSRDGARHGVWTLLPLGMDEPDDVWRALSRRKTAVAATLSDSDTPQVQVAPRSIFSALIAGWRSLGRAAQTAALLGIVAIVAFCWSWGAQIGHKSQPPSGPKTALGFLRRRRLAGRLTGAVLIVLAFAATIVALTCVLNGVSLGDALHRLPPARTPALQNFFVAPSLAIGVWGVANGLFFYGRALWNRTH